MSVGIRARQLRLGTLIVGMVGATAATAGIFPAVTAQAADPTVTAAYSSTIGGPGHATMYASGMEIVPQGAPNAGDIIIADTGNNQVAEYTTTGTQLWRVGSEGTGASAANIQFEQPRDVGVDSAGNVYVADNGNGRVMKLSPTGAYITKWKSEATGTAGAPIGITVSNTTTSLPNLPAGQRVYVADGAKNQITVWNTNGTAVTPTAAATINSTGACTLNRMRDAAADPMGNVYVANYESNNILEFSWNGSAWTCANHFGTKGTQSSTTLVCSGNGNGAFKNPYGVVTATDPTLNSGMGAEAVYVADSNDDCIQEFTPSGTFIAEFGAPGTDVQDGTFFQLRRVAVDASGNVWGADLWGNRLVEYTRSAGTYTYSQTLPNPIVGPGGTSTSVFNQVRGMSFDATGDIVSMDTVNQRVAVFDPTGNLINFCGQRGFTDTGDFNWPRGVAVDPTTGNYWVADTKQSDIQVLPPNASPPSMPGCGAGTFVTQTLGTAPGDVDYPDSIAIAGGYAWVADTKNNRIDSWNVSTKAAVANYGTLGAGNGQFKTPTGIAVDPTTGDVFVADSGNNRVVELSVTAGHVNGSGNPVATFTDNFVQPYGVASNGHGLVAVADRGNNRVVVLNEDGTVAATINGNDVTGGGPTVLFHPENVAFAPNGNLDIADTYNDRILSYTLSTGGGGGTGPLVAPTYASTLLGPGQASMYPVDVTNDSQYYFVLDAGNFRIAAVNRTTDVIDCQIGGLQGNGPGQMGDARAVDFDAANNELYLADTPNNRIEIFSFSDSACAANSPTAFAFLSQFGAKGTGNAQFSQAYGVAVDPATTPPFIYAVDGAGRVEKFNATTNAYISSFGQGSLNQPRQVAVAPNGDIFVMNARNHTCDIYSGGATGNDTLIKQFGSQGTGPGQFTDDPRGVAVSADGTLAFVTDSGGKRIEAFNLVQSGGHYTNASGTFAYTIPSAVSGPGQFVGPRGLTTTSDNHLLLTDEWGFNLHQMTFTATGVANPVDTTPTAPPVPGVNSPRGVHVAANGQIYVQDYWNMRVEYVNPDGSGATSFGFRGNVSQSGAINFAWDFAIQPVTGNIFVANRENNQIAIFSPTGTPIPGGIFGKAGTANGQFSFPQGIVFAPDGTLLVDDSGNDRIQRFSMNGADTVATWMATYGQKGTGVTSPAGDLNNPTGISVAPDGTIWVADTLNNRIQSLAPNGTTWKVISKPTGTGTQLGFKVPWGVTVAPDGSIWVSDIGNNRIVSVSTTGSLNFSASEASMGIPAVPADNVIYPYEVAFSNGPGPYNVYLTDIWNNRVLVLTTHNS
jgi:DNA-binding beta-propeller fold protein YncE